ncbi:diaminopimelate decarboxylase [Thraustotheca clavata]|uniref:Diaminopimelate decarboxylase n=1 Tax=Thraustotheca clavata TaxID=74557 RepID=A0A1V9Y4I9_9STRA|nr:diaminopimelate decarboxylase [Thraustotheca clavata]
MESILSFDFNAALGEKVNISSSLLALEVCKKVNLDPKMTVSELIQEFIERKKIKKENDVPDDIEAHAARAQGVKDVVHHLVHEKLVDDLNPVVDLFDMDMFELRLNELVEAFPNFWTHALAIKANPLAGILLQAKPLGIGLETASFAEGMHAVKLGFSPEKIIIDSPCKALHELKTLMLLGCYVNLDNLTEIHKVQTLYDHNDNENTPFLSKIGLRINPVVGGGTIAASSTATATSKFGLIWTPETEDELVNLFATHSWLQGIHVHVGSQGCALDLLVAGAKRAVEFALLVNKRIERNQVCVIDIGGGVPTIYNGLKMEAVTYKSYASLLQSRVPGKIKIRAVPQKHLELFSGEFKVITEFGRSIFAKPGITLSRVEAVKDWNGHRVAVINCGANQFLRSVYLPKTWPLKFSVFDASGQQKTTSFVPQDLAGPLCFSGDVVARQALLPLLETGDYVVIHDTGAYTMAMYSKFNSIPAPATLAYRREGNRVYVSRVKARETVEETLAFWGEHKELLWK